MINRVTVSVLYRDCCGHDCTADVRVAHCAAHACRRDSAARYGQLTLHRVSQGACRFGTPNHRGRKWLRCQLRQPLRLASARVAAATSPGVQFCFADSDRATLRDAAHGFSLSASCRHGVGLRDARADRRPCEPSPHQRALPLNDHRLRGQSLASHVGNGADGTSGTSRAPCAWIPCRSQRTCHVPYTQYSTVARELGG